MTDLITFTCYGCHLHGDETGSVDRRHRAHGTPILESDPHRAASDTRRMEWIPYTLDAPRRNAVLASIQEVCRRRTWRLLAAHVRATHVHVVVETDAEPERVLTDLTSYASRHLNELALDAPGRKRWTRHGSTRWLWSPKHISATMEYVVNEQGEPMAVFQDTDA